MKCCCKDCRFIGEDYLTSYSGIGTYRFAFCQLVIYALKLVDPDVERDCEAFQEKQEEVVEDAFRPNR